MNIMWFLRKKGDEHIRPPRELALTAMAALLIVVFVFGIFLLGRSGVHAWSAYQHVQALLTLTDAGIGVQSLAPAQRHLDGLAEETRRLMQATRPALPLLSRLEGRSVFGIQIAEAPAFLEATHETAALMADFLAMVRASSLDPVQPLPDYLLAATVEQAQALSLLSGRAQVAQRMLLALDADALPPALAEPFSRLQASAHFLEAALLLSPSLSHLLGFAEPAHYLVLVQNNQEARASGGFISGVALVTLEAGELTTLSFSDSYAVDNLAVAHPAAPPAMQRYLDAPLIFLRDTNWSPHFPISARTAQAVYARDQGVAVDGVISVDLRALELLVEAVEPITIAGWPEPITAENVLPVMMSLWQAPISTEERIDTDRNAWWAERKDFMGVLAEALLAEVQLKEVDDLALLAPALHQALEERAIQVWLEDGGVAQHLARWGWDGGLRTAEGVDYLSVIDSNVGFNKVNAVVERAVDYAVHWPQGVDMPAQATVTITYTHPIEMPDHLCNRRARYGDTYEEMMRRCYFNYVRVYVPRGSELQATAGLEDGSQETQPGEAGTTVLAGYFVLKPGATHTVKFTYRLPPDIRPDTYRLILQRQSGSGPLPMSWDVAGVAGEVLFGGNWMEWGKD